MTRCIKIKSEHNVSASQGFLAGADISVKFVKKVFLKMIFAVSNPAKTDRSDRYLKDIFPLFLFFNENRSYIFPLKKE